MFHQSLFASRCAFNKLFVLLGVACCLLSYVLILPAVLPVLPLHCVLPAANCIAWFRVVMSARLCWSTGSHGHLKSGATCTRPCWWVLSVLPKLLLVPKRWKLGAFCFAFSSLARGVCDPMLSVVPCMHIDNPHAAVRPLASRARHQPLTITPPHPTPPINPFLQQQALEYLLVRLAATVLFNTAQQHTNLTPLCTLTPCSQHTTKTLCYTGAGIPHGSWQ